MTEYWFARYRPGPPQTASRGLIVLSWQGRGVIAGFILSFLVGVTCFAVGLAGDHVAIGIVLWVVCIIAGAGTFLWASVARTDPMKPASEYLAERQAHRAAGRQSA
jgi:hypothetical protein